MISRFEKELLIAHAFGLTRAQLLARRSEELDPARYQPLLDRRARDEPTAYILGGQPFFGLDMLVDRSVLIPRPETELLVEAAVNLIQDKKLSSVADLGTGSGCIAISLAKKFPGLKVIATDASPAALQVARENAQKHGVKKNIEFYASDRFAAPVQVDLIISNPPYIPSAEIERLDPEVKDWEPLLALDGGPDGLNFIRELIKLDYRYLALEFGFGQGAEIRSLAKDQGKEALILKDYAGIERIAIINEKSN